MSDKSTRLLVAEKEQSDQLGFNFRLKLKPAGENKQGNKRKRQSFICPFSLKNTCSSTFREQYEKFLPPTKRGPNIFER
jgi:hypothetical protein